MDTSFTAGEYAGQVPPNKHSIETIETLNLGSRTLSFLKKAGIRTVGDLIARSEADLLNQTDVRRTELKEIMIALISRGLHLRTS